MQHYTGVDNSTNTCSGSHNVENSKRESGSDNGYGGGIGNAYLKLYSV